QSDGKSSCPPALADARVEDWRLLARIGAHDEERVGRLDAGNGGVEQVGGAAELGIEGAAVLAAIEIGNPEPAHEVLQRKNLLDRRKVAGDGADAGGTRRLDLGGD